MSVLMSLDSDLIAQGASKQQLVSDITSVIAEHLLLTAQRRFAIARSCKERCTPSLRRSVS